MGWRSVMISRPAKLRREHYSLAIEQEQTAFVPFEDIAVIVLNHREINLTHPVLSACAEYGIGLYATGHNHQPSGVFLPFLQHSRTTRLMRKQLDIAKPLAGHMDVDAIWAFDGTPAAMIEKESTGNLKRTWVANGQSRDWRTEGEGRAFLARATEVKTVWVPSGE